jgi:diguanylate cyclase (GGDEF)-like protein
MKARVPFILFVSVSLLVAGTFWSMKVITDHLLFANATTAAQKWADYLVENITDFPEIARGERPSTTSEAFLRGSRNIRFVFRYEIFNSEGFPQLIADDHCINPVEVAEANDDAARASRSGQPIVAVHHGESGGPSFFAEAYVPVRSEGETIAVVAAHVDQVHERELFYNTFLAAAFVMCGLTALAFALPAAAWYRRTKEKQRADSEILFLAKHDSMTRLSNRPHFLEQVAKLLLDVPGSAPRIAIHYIDLDRFKEVNDSLGHAGGDALIQAMATRLRDATRATDIVARMGGDEFAIAQPIDSIGDAVALAHRVLAVMAQPFTIDDFAVVTTASVGIALAPQDGRDPDRLIRRADLALYKSKAEGRNRARFFTADLDEQRRDRLELERRIRTATQDKEFELHFQPVVNLRSEKTIGFEALLRLRATDGTPISPAEFIPAAEEMGLITPIGSWVIREACSVASTWPDHLKIAVNISPVQVHDGGLVDTVRAALAASSLEPSRLELEVTEGVFMSDTDFVLAELGRLKRLGVRVVMDDFGTGYSSLSYLWRFPFDKVKIDRSFVQTLGHEDKNVAAIIRTIIALGHSLNMQVSVEGVENEDQLVFVRDVSCDEVQGFYFGRPAPVADMAGPILNDFVDGLRRQLPSRSAGARA